MPNIDIRTQQKHIRDFSKKREDYILYADIIKQILEKAVKHYAPLGIIQSRAKTIPSFSEKIIRKDKYIKPLEEITDLCGARIICQFSSQVAKVCEFIRNHFEIDELNSLDVKSRLNVGEFGYRSIHYIVSPGQSNILGIEIPHKLNNLKCEIQVRTYGEHIWADIVHDRIYKAPIQIPAKWMREAARLAALLENADEAFLRLSDTIDQLAINYLPTPRPEKFKNEIEIYKTLLEIDPDISDKTVPARLKLVQFYILEGAWEEAIELLKPVLNNMNNLNDILIKNRIYYETGYVLCQNFRDNTGSEEFKKGIKLIEEAILMPGKGNSVLDLAKAWYYKGKVSRLNNSPGEETIKAFENAHKYAPHNPYYYISYLIENIFGSSCNNKTDFQLFSSKLKECIRDCKDNIELGIEVAQSLFTIVKAAVLLKDRNLALNSYIKAIDYVLNDKVVCSKQQIEDELSDIERIVSNIEEGGECLIHLGEILLWQKYDNRAALKNLKRNMVSSARISDQVLIIAGNGVLDKTIMDTYIPYIQELLRDYEGTVISGGTNSGISCLVGSETGKFSEERKFNLLGYHPAKLTDGIKEEKNYDEHIVSGRNTFSFLDVLKYWVDILSAGTSKDNILLTGFSGGPIALLEYKFALAMGVKTALLLDSGGAVSDLIQDNFWNKKENLMIVPRDPYTFWALANQNKPVLFTDDEIELLAIKIHKSYRKVTLQWYNAESDNVNQYKTIMDWDLLDPKLKISNIRQAKFIQHLLKRVDLNIQKAENPNLFVFDKQTDCYKLLARLEHARWNAERLTNGWKLGNEKNISGKISPYIKRWDLLDKKIKEFDFQVVNRLPKILGSIGYEIIKK